MTVRAKNPKTTVGIPASTSSMGLMMLRILLGAYSLNQIAVMRPSGRATHMAMKVTCKVPVIKGQMP